MHSIPVEAATSAVYGETFARYNPAEFLEFLAPLEKRLTANGIPPSVFDGRLCLDAGCGGGRGSVLMARAGAARVVACDLSEQNIDSTGRAARRFGLTNIETRRASLLDLPFPDETFDVVWCNGVIHHTVNPDGALSELARVLKTGGHLWLYVYGSGGIYWFLVDFLRHRLGDIPLPRAMLYLTLAGVPTGRIAEFMDDWFVPLLKRYVHADLARRLKELGFPATPRLMGGVAYDTSVRSLDPADQPWMGEGDLRYWVRKQAHRASAPGEPLPDVQARGSAWEDPPEVLAFRDPLASLFDTVEALAPGATEWNASARTLTAGQLQTALRDRMSLPGAFDHRAFREWTEALHARYRNELPA
jgi:ubiquinone/menaquinone biosynthesis C-methylase UbiE